MSVQLTPKGTRGLNVPKLPRSVWKIMQAFTSRRIQKQGGKLLDLTTIGSKTGEERTVPLRYFDEGPNQWLIVASFGGATKHPSWYVNMAKNPDKVWIQIGKEKIKVRGESLHGAEREKVWEKVVAAAPSYAEYQTKTDREIPVIRLTRV